MNLMHDFARSERAPIRKSVQDNSFKISTSFPTGFLIPLAISDTCPASTRKNGLGSFARMGLTPLKPVMDHAYMDEYAFFVPYRILWDGFRKVYGEGEPTEWDTPTEATVPYFDPSTTALQPYFTKYSVFDYLGYNIADKTSRKLSILPLLAYIRVWEDFFRDANLQSRNPGTSVLFNATSGADVSSSVVTLLSYLDDLVTGTKLYKLNRYHDYFSSALPSQQLGSPVTFGMAGTAPVKATTNGTVFLYNLDAVDNAEAGSNIRVGTTIGPAETKSSITYGSDEVPGRIIITNSTLTGAGAYADLSLASPISVTDLRYSIALQALKELDARCGGLRYNTNLLGHFGTAPLDETLQRPELLGAKHYELGMTTVTNNSNTNTGSLGAYSATSRYGGMFNKSFKEPGLLIWVGGVRVKHSYSQGEEKLYYKTRRYDWYDPLLNNISEQPVMRRELYAGDQSNVFGFQEAWAEYRYHPDKVTGGMRKGIYNDLNAWNYGDYYLASPVLNGSWMKESPDTIGQALTNYSHFNSDILASMILYDGFVELLDVLPMTTHSIPRLLDR